MLEMTGVFVCEGDDDVVAKKRKERLFRGRGQKYDIK